jgi:hypothetical protein
MNDISSKRILAEELLKQDSGVSDAHMEEQRSQLVFALERAERTERIMRRAATVSCVLLASMVFLMSAVLVAFPVARIIGGVITFILLIVAGTLLSLYNDRYRPAVSKKREELQATVLADLQCQIKEMKKMQSGERRE